MPEGDGRDTVHSIPCRWTCLSSLEALHEYHLAERETTQMQLRDINSKNTSFNAPFLRVELEKGKQFTPTKQREKLNYTDYALGRKQLT
jgi:hypothetical protein